MNDSDVTTVGLSEHADDLLEQLKEQEVFAEKLDGYRFAISLAAASGVVPAEIGKRKALEWLASEVQLVDENGDPIDRKDLELPDLAESDSEEDSDADTVDNAEESHEEDPEKDQE